MLKKLITLTFGLMAALGASAQYGPGNTTVPQDSIRFWTGTGSNRAVIAITWDDDAAGTIGIAWGVQWNGTLDISSAMDSIAAYDQRVTLSGTHSFLTNIEFNDSDLGLSLIGEDGWWVYDWKDASGTFKNSGGASNDILAAGDFVDWASFGVSAADIMLYAEDPNAPDPLPEEATIAASDILYWIGEGQNEVVLAINWPDTALAWGYRFDGSKTVGDMMNDIAANDPRFSIIPGAYGIDDILFVTAAGDTLRRLATSWWGSTNNGVMDMGMGQTLTNGDFEKWADGSTGILVDSIWVEDWNAYNYIYVYPMTISPVSIPLPEEATIAASEIQYWVGEGQNEVVLAVNWPTRALAWGYRFDGTKTVGDMMNDIADADPRFSIIPGAYGIDDILFVTATGDTLRRLATSWWGSTNNGVMDMGMGQTLTDGDFEKWADGSTGVLVDSAWVEDWNAYNYIYVYPMPVFPVSAPIVNGPFCGAVGTEGCTAVAANDPRIKGWATACTVERGYQVISTAAALASYGNESYATGAVDMNDNLSVVSLGDGGTATLTFDEPITNIDGFDFAVYENSFGDAFLELAFVEVSSDGQHFVRFPATSLTQTEVQTGGNGSTDPTMINNLAGKYRFGYGTPFDLNELRDSTGIDINNITHVRVVDVVGSIDPQYGTRDSKGRIINDPWPTPGSSSGFDLDGVAVLKAMTQDIISAENISLTAYPNPAAERVCITLNGSDKADAQLFDINGQMVMSFELHNGSNIVELSSLAQGVYVLRSSQTIVKIVKK